uniref:Uncharacterized protein n=1 Tax=Physcomitrium patens TaxID=3218 RepID=A9RXQ5_PHYPA|nr:hypothetical protein PHYPA_018842 [Physcomitrium patens]
MRPLTSFLRRVRQTTRVDCGRRSRSTAAHSGRKLRGVKAQRKGGSAATTLQKIRHRPHHCHHPPQGCGSPAPSVLVYCPPFPFSCHQFSEMGVFAVNYAFNVTVFVPWFLYVCWTKKKVLPEPAHDWFLSGRREQHSSSRKNPPPDHGKRLVDRWGRLDPCVTRLTS